MDLLDLEEYDFALPEEQIAKFPAEDRAASRLLCLDRSHAQIQEHSHFREIATYFKPGDILVYNETKVSKRRVFLHSKSERIHEAIFLKPLDELASTWECILKFRRKLKLGDLLFLNSESSLHFRFEGKMGELSILKANRPLTEEDFEVFGNIPIPPYLKRLATEEDEIRYQTVFAKQPGSVAAPTAGLHFTEDLVALLQSAGIEFLPVQLKIGYGTFQGLTEEQLKSKSLHSEEYSLAPLVASRLTNAKRNGQRIIAIGTTSLRVLETVYEKESQIFHPGEGKTDIFLSPGDHILSIDGIITNFHLPKSSLILLVSTFAGKNLIKEAYGYALTNQFRFYSYGDAMFIY
ncbi:S-adenosylmethionine:tRNA ribosyltransferase-isomerase [Leptospira ryugenii]|uniref:S-adenosylmethionine:tRNA ribosyltransferase-isomerase n=1 Tax=Leptospira ryugenii TaxID=1917863 RepID=A0A2P2E512_9LEPT|nr:tRNA preQ1(34) S-adenosylmethionine ribosyltransferase-isomerase QueA [Leptospira ryugenii]GBF51952.1 S-adenosylmethionine:tRNA ribosyltransferase-isomerase [Leptospira ryugenii]